jgi:hypothetical protein
MIKFDDVQLLASAVCFLAAGGNLLLMKRAIVRERKARALIDSLKVVGKVEPDGDGFNVYLDPRHIPVGEILYTVKALKPERTMTL